MSGRGRRGVGISFLEPKKESEEETIEEETPENCPTCNQPMGLSAEKAQFQAKLSDQCDDCCCGSCGARKRRPGQPCC